MKSYKDLPKEVVMNAPEGAMWVKSDLVYGISYCKIIYGTIHYHWVDFEWRPSGHTLRSFQHTEAIPLPNIEIPWEATDDSECPVPDGTEVWLKFKDGETLINNAPQDYLWNGYVLEYIVAYKILDKEYMKVEQNPTPIKVAELPSISPDAEDFLFIRDEPPLHNPLTIVSWSTKKEQLRIQLTSKLDFLQILGDKYPEIKDKVVKLMGIELDAWWHEEVEMEEENN